MKAIIVTKDGEAKAGFRKSQNSPFEQQLTSPPRAAQWPDRSHHSYEGERNVFVPTCYTQQCKGLVYFSVQPSTVQFSKVQHSRV